jgi:hypothetical protein
VRVTTAFNRLLGLPGASVTDVEFSSTGVIVTVRLKRRRRVCGCCGQLAGHVHDRRVKRWRHLDRGGSQCWLECELRRVWCRDCGVRSEAVPWARAGARHTRDFEDVVAWLAQQMAKTPITRLVRVGWDTVGTIIERVVEGTGADHRPAGECARPPAGGHPLPASNREETPAHPPARVRSAAHLQADFGPFTPLPVSRWTRAGVRR